MHIPVLEKEVLQYLEPQSNENFIDCTLGQGGHALAILEKVLPKGKVLGIDRTPELIEQFRRKYQGKEIFKNFLLVCDNFRNLKEIVERENFYPVNGILFDLGLSTWHLRESKKGFSFLQDEILDMRYDTIEKGKESEKLTAAEIVNEYSQKEIEKILREYGEERFSGRIAKEIVKARKLKPIKTTFELVEIIKKAVPGIYLKKRIHPGTRTFQALRIAVNDELGNLKEGLSQALEILSAGGRLAVISFHSLEDRIVKNFFRQKAKENLIKIITKKPIIPSEFEIKLNSASRSAKLRAVIKV